MANLSGHDDVIALSRRLMLTLTTALLLLAVIIIALYAFGVFNTPYLDAFRFAFYLLLALLVMSIWFSVIEHLPYEGYDPTKGGR